MSQYLVDELKAQGEKVRVLTRTRVAGVAGDGRLEAITIENLDTGEQQTVASSALFIFIGAQPHTEWLDEQIQRDKHGFILTGAELLVDGRCPKGWPLDRDPFLLETSLPGIFAAGDVRRGSVKRVTSGVGEGAIACTLIHQYLSTL
jgi:thioredoxin reductase (NADPH)